ncbi:MAG TPA: MFS transporter [Candidatus Acidoferrum sp.]|nr:MFS transporter [Candidatus Acidoferrum sp.]
MRPERLGREETVLQERFLGSIDPRRLAESLGLERNVAAASGAVFLVGLGEELWKKFLPKYLESLGASVTVVGLFGTSEDFLDALYQYPGGWLADRWGRRQAFLTFLFAALMGYLVYLFSPSWPFLFVGLAFVMAWQSMASPAIFAIIGDALPKEQRAMGFTIQSMLKRIPMVVSPLLGGAMIGALGLQTGIRTGLVITIAFVGVTIPLLMTINLPFTSRDTVKVRGVWNSFHSVLKRLLVSDIAIRTCEGMADIFVVLYVTNVTGISIPRYGILVAVQLATAILVYIPSAKMAHRLGRKPFVIATFLCFAFFPVAIAFAPNFRWLVCAFVIGGLREIGEPARKAMIVDLAQHNLRARSVGLYYLVRSLSITPASAIGGLLWRIRPQTPFLVAGAFGIVGTLLFAATVKEQCAD